MKSNYNFRARYKSVLLIASLGLIVFLVAGFYRADKLTVTRYQVESSAFLQPLTIVHLSDLHCCEYGSDNELLLCEIYAAKPDMIVMTGDMISRNSTQKEIAHVLELISALSQTAPVFYSLGNHELDYINTQGDVFLSQVTDAGAIVLEHQYQQITLNDQDIRVGGIYGYLLSPKQQNGPEQEFMRDFSDTDCPTILLCHMSEGLLDYGSIDEWNADVVFSGHAHGGQVRLPLFGGLYDPETGWFPRYEKGMFQKGGSTVIVSSGLGSSERIPRFNNPPELVVVSIVPDAAESRFGVN